ncbi:unnamed protein product [Musa textilis]
MFFPWLIGRCEVRKSEIKGKSEKNVVYIPKCRFLESTNCVGMCTNLCKIPSQKFIQDSLGMPVYMVPSSLYIWISTMSISNYKRRIFQNKCVKHFLSASLLDFSRRLVPLSEVLCAMSKDGLYKPLLCSTFFHSSRCLRRNCLFVSSLPLHWTLFIPEGNLCSNSINKMVARTDKILAVKESPNFEDMSCEMIFGQQPPLDDPALKQPCYHKSCNDINLSM